jgi:uncharacterized damage-inducible protein DinB
MRVFLAVLAAIVAIPVSGAQGQDAPPGFRGEFLHQFDQSMAKVIALAEAVPATIYARRPVPAVVPLGQAFGHIAHYNYEYPARAMGIVPPRDIDRDTLDRVRDKADVVALLRSSVEHVRRSVRGMPDEQLRRMTTLYGRRVPQWAVLLQLLAHLNDHLGQSIAYARASGVVPPWSQ